jgi:hypothetical protein
MLDDQGGVPPEKTFRGLLGGGVLAVWSGVDAEHEAEFNHWYTHQHLPERVGIPGFLRGRRYIGPEEVPCHDGGKYFTLYETESLETLASAPYLLRLNNPTPWTRRVVPLFRNGNRTACRVTASLGRGVGGWAATVEFGAGPGEDGRLRAWLHDEAMPAALERDPGLIGIHLLEADQATTQAKDQTEESRAGAGRDRRPLARWVVMAEGTSEGAVQGACGLFTAPSGLSEHGAAGHLTVRRYRLLVSLSE